ncbi:MAG: DUF3788 domain-containing protein [Thermoleophilia bacterium]|nr:DUF3788 domain-containing protein [Thermoleophilia bacterium]
MSEETIRMTDRDHTPSDAEVAEWMGEEAHYYWRQVTESIERLYPGVFVPEWLYGGKKHGWALRYKKSKPLCTLVPEKGRCALLLVFGAEERARVEAVRSELTADTLAAYDAATTYHDGKWLLLTVDSEETVQDVARLWATKRRPKGEL